MLLTRRNFSENLDTVLELQARHLPILLLTTVNTQRLHLLHYVVRPAVHFTQTTTICTTFKLLFIHFTSHSLYERIIWTAYRC
jgi:hypothetical protein